MNISKLLNNADDAYINYRHRCEALAKEAQKYIDWDNGVSCEHLPAVSWQLFPMIVIRVECLNVFVLQMCFFLP